MTSSDIAVLRPGAVELTASRVGTSYAGDGGAPTRQPPQVAVVCAKFNGAITERLLDGVLGGFHHSGVPSSSVTVVWVPGAFEIPMVAQRLALHGGMDAIVALGAVIRGETAHFDFVAGQCAAGLQRVALDSGVPVVFGVLTTDTVDQALARCREGQDNKGFEAAVTALEMIDLLWKLPAPSSETPDQPPPC
jgi:6,7-dimethyl-8-ribityllumazine synthase